MKTISKLCFILVGFTFASCQWSVKPKEDKEVFKDTLAYSYKVIDQKPTDCTDKPGNPCTSVKINYPYFVGQNKLNRFLTVNITAMFPGIGKTDTTIQQIIRTFLDYNQKSNKKYKLNTYKIYTRSEVNIRVLLQDSSLSTLQICHTIKELSAAPVAASASPMVEYHLPAKPSAPPSDGNKPYEIGEKLSSINFINWNTKANKNITLNDLFIDGYADKLKAIAESIFRKEEKLSDTSSLARDYFFKDNKFTLNDNFSVTPIGLKFVYNQYEIKPYAAGITELFVPYSQIKTLLRPNTVVSKFVK